MADTPSGPLGAFSKTIFAAPFNLGQRLEHLFEWWVQLATGDTPEWRRFIVTFEDNVSTENADNAQISFDFVNYTAGSIDTSWTESDFDAVNGHLATILTAWLPFMDSKHMIREINAYRMTFKDGWVGSSPTTRMYPFNVSGPPEWTQPYSSPGTNASGLLPPQCAVSCTEMVPVRRSWGRFYLPFPGGSCVDTAHNRWAPSVASTMATAISNAYTAAANAELYPVVPITYSQGARVGALMTCSGIRIDNVPDVIRRRRFKHATQTVTLPVQATQTLPANSEENVEPGLDASLPGV